MWGSRESRGDFFISYAAADQPWAEWIAWQLEEAGYHVLIQAWDYVVGRNWVAAIQEGLDRFDRMVVVLSDAYLTSVYPSAEWRSVYAADPNGVGRRLVPVRVEDCRPPGLLTQIVPFDVFGLDGDKARSELLRAVEANRAGRAKPLSRPPLPGRGGRSRAPSLPDGPATATGGRAPSASASPTLIATLEAHRFSVRAVAFAPVGGLLATVGQAATALLWDVRTPERPLRAADLPHSRNRIRGILGVAFSPDGATLATGGSGGEVVLWDVTEPGSPYPRATLDDHRDRVRAVAFSPDGQLLATGGSDHTVLLWRLDGGPRRVAALAEHRDTVLTAAFHPREPILVTGGKDAAVMVWDVADPARPRLVTVLREHRHMVRCVVITGDGRLLATGSEDRTVMLWDLADPWHPTRNQTITAARPLLTLAADPRGGQLATGGVERAVVLWDVRDPARPVRTARLDRHDHAVWATAFNATGTLLATAGRDRKVLLWRTET
ncbi:hypothetical protein BL253_04215 [Pseudofrankia asymbiotica]|uniref:TIR domain-containing protein n=1 Tax=Pseudofrankia asymbiotica TaxID=1834516 RepID=A0A1V2IIH5_9ACTN|nr:hypothetical protein BL253_04215 [Pseudofrankia asymbiotica]